MVLLSDVDGDILLLPVCVRHVKKRLHYYNYTLLRGIAFESITYSTSRACFIALHVCSSKICFYYLQKFNLETCSENRK